MIKLRFQLILKSPWICVYLVSLFIPKMILQIINVSRSNKIQVGDIKQAIVIDVRNDALIISLCCGVFLYAQVND
jgi:hypothetical protein